MVADLSTRSTQFGAYALLVVLVGCSLAGAVAGVTSLASGRSGSAAGSISLPISIDASARPATVPNTVVATISGISSPITGAYDPANGEIYLPDTTSGDLSGDNSSNLTIVDGATDKVVDTMFFGPYSYLATPNYVPSDQEIYVADQNGSGVANNVSAISSANAIVANINTGNSSAPTTGTYDPVNHDLFVPDDGSNSFPVSSENVSVIDTATQTVIAQVAVGLTPGPGVYDPADGDVYIPDSDLGSTNLTIINGTTDAVVATISGLETPITPAYDPVNQEVYVPDSGGYNITVLKGTSVVTTIAVNSLNDGTLDAAPTVDPITGDVFVPLYVSNEVLVLSPSNQILGSIQPGSEDLADEAAVFDPVNQQLYVPGSDPTEDTGEILVLNVTTDALTVAIPVGGSPQTPTFDPATDTLFVPNLDTNNVSVIAAGPLGTTSAPGTYAVTFAESGLPAGTSWNVTLDGYGQNATTSTIVFAHETNGSHSYEIGPWGDVDECVLDLASESGSVSVSGKGVTVSVPFTCASTSVSSGTGGLLLGLGLLVVAVVVIVVVVIVVVVVVVVLLARSGPSTPPPPVMPPPPPPPPPPV